MSGFMALTLTGPCWWTITEDAGYVPLADVPREALTYDENDERDTSSDLYGYGARYSASGYMDATEYVVDASPLVALERCFEMYDDGDEASEAEYREMRERVDACGLRAWEDAPSVPNIDAETVDTIKAWVDSPSVVASLDEDIRRARKIAHVTLLARAARLAGDISTATKHEADGDRMYNRLSPAARW